MAEHAVQHDVDAAGFGGAAQLCKILVGPQNRVHLAVVRGVVTVVGVGFEDGVEVDACHTKAGEVRQLFADARQVSAVIVHVQIALMLFVWPEIGFTALVRAVDAVGIGHGSMRAAFKEAVRKDLVNDAAAQMAWSLKILFVYRQLPGLAVACCNICLAKLPGV